MRRLLMRWQLRFFRTWPVAAAALGGLLLLIYASVATTSRKAEEIYAQLDQLNTHHREVEGKLRRLRSDVHLSSIYIRDYLLDTDQEEGPQYRQRLTELRQNHAVTVQQLRALLPPDGAPRMDNLQTGLDEYWQAFEPLFEWSTYEKIMRSARFLRREVLPRREAVLEITADIEQLNNANLAAQREEVTRRLTAFREDLHRRLWRALLLGFLVALVAVLRLRALERRSELQRVHAEQAEQEMRLLSQQLVAAQEEERKKLTRELHDHVGQMLTALRMEIGRADRARSASGTQLGQAIGEAKRLLDTILRSVRDLVMGLRPSMLDDFGLQPALEWHVRDFRRRFNIPVDLSLDGDLDTLPDPYRTCVYRIVQEALTNCARHAQATGVEIRVHLTRNTLELLVSDDGAGIDPARTRGVGLLGIEERVRELHGAFRIASREPHGTELHVTLPVTTPIAAAEEVHLARAAG
ncbi:MAG TPA: sensor histidine kinase [Thermoanaerobaculia bacterium]|nr:sensor histidine kinase [Thermoanaerobaculia bacterium]